MLNTLAVICCLVMAVLSLKEIWKPNKFGIAGLWVSLGAMTYILGKMLDLLQIYVDKL